MVTRAEQNRKDAAQTFRSMMDQTVTHVRVGQGPAHGTEVRMLGLAKDLHGLDGVCTCCPRRPAGELSGRQQAAGAARAAAQRAAELGPIVPAAPLSFAVPLPIVDRPAKDEAIARARAAAIDSAARLGRAD